MKASVTSENASAYAGIYCSGGAGGSSGAGAIGIGGGATSRITKAKRDVENEEIQAYLSRLKELVPFMPKNRRLSKLEVIQYVIDYICDLQHALETHPNINSAAVHSAAAAVMLSSASQSAANLQILNPLHRQPLAILPPNANVKHINTPNSCSSPESSPVLASRQTEKVGASSEKKNVSC